MREKARFYYDKLNDLLHVFIPGKSVKTLLIGDIAFDIDRHNKFIGIEITNASDLLQQYGIGAELLERIEKAEIVVTPVSANTAMVGMYLHIPKQEEPSKVLFAVDLINEKPQEALASS
ncbi:MAG TPA: DUF2283 domain-containing protein [Candidatus Nanoarchaeia archaeon]|nr:DUF2283 domain-containing protein [Candidatus Nanoarchaeia archaeon]